MLKHKTKNGYKFKNKKHKKFAFGMKKKNENTFKSGVKNVGSFFARRLQKGACKADPTCASSGEYDCKVMIRK